MKRKRHALFAMKAPCGNCPFLREGAIALGPGRLDGIIAGLLQDDYSIFHCHKTVHHITKGGEWVADEDGNEQYVPSGHESACVGALVYSLKAGRPPVSLRLALMTGDVTYDALMAQDTLILDPPQEPQA